MKKLILVSTFCNNEEKQQVLFETVQKIKNLGLDILVISPNFIKIRQDVIESSDYFFYTKENPLLKWPIRQYTHWYEQPLTPNKVTTIHRGFADYGWAALYQTKKLLQFGLTFNYDLFHHIIYDLEISPEIESELLSDEVNVIHCRRNPKNIDEIWETTLHLMTFDREMAKKIEKEIVLENYLNGNGVAEGEVLKWRDKFKLKTSPIIVKDRIFYWENFDFFDYSPFKDFKMFVSKNEEFEIWLGYDKPYPEQLTSNLRLVFHEIKFPVTIDIEVDENKFELRPKNWEIIEIPMDSQKIKKIKFTYNNETHDFSEEYKNVMMNQVYYNYR